MGRIFYSNTRRQQARTVKFNPIIKNEDSFEAESKENEVNDTIEKKRFTRKKQVVKQEVDELDFEDDFEEEDEIGGDF